VSGLGPFEPPLSTPFRPQPSIAQRTSGFRTSYREPAMASVASDQFSTMPRGRKRRDVTGKVEGRKFACDTAGCGRSFTRAEHLQRHLLNHSTGEHTCDRCRAHFKRRDLLGKPAFPSCNALWKLVRFGFCAACMRYKAVPSKSGIGYLRVTLSHFIVATPSFFYFEMFERTVLVSLPKSWFQDIDSQ
jgi:hypothetical protein